MKRSMFRRKTPFRSTRKNPMRRSAVRRVSAKREGDLVAYRALKDSLVWVPGAACVVCGGVPTDLHHRREAGMGGAFPNPENVVPVDRSCHDLIHANQAWSRSEGLLVSEGDPGWNDLGERVWRESQHGRTKR